MKKKYIVMLVACILLIVAGICYSVAYFGLGSDTPVITTLSEDGMDNRETQLTIPSATGNQAAASSADGLSEAAGKLTGDDGSDVDKPLTGNASEKSSDENLNFIYVHLCGAVTNPSVYRVASGSRLVEIIELAGGLTEDAAGDYVNQAMTVEDGQRIYIPTKSEVQELPSEDYISSGGSESQPEESQLININKADSGELMELPGIGQAKADSIIAYREAGGGFQSIEELMNVPGIKEGLFSRISTYITVK